MNYCSKCVYPSASAVKLTFDDEGLCSGCRVYNERKKVDWEKRAKMLFDFAQGYKDKTAGKNYDCIIPVSGGKDSYFQAYYATEVLGLKPLLVTYHGNNYLPEGARNLERMRNVFNADHCIFKPAESLLIKLNRLCFRMMGDMNWHAHCGIYTYPVQVAVKYKIPLIIWGEHGFAELGGMYSMNDFPEMTAKFRLEHVQRGFDWFNMIEKSENINEQDLLWAKYPTDEEIDEVGVRGIYLGNFVNWDGNFNYQTVKEKYGWEARDIPFERTYRMFSNLDDMHENGMHDYLKFIKFGYGRASDHASKDIRAQKMTRAEGIEMVKKYDAVKSSDLKRWLEYVNMTEEEFDQTADTFRDPKVWWIENGEWWKDNIWGEPSSYGKVYLPKELQGRYKTKK